MLTKDILINGNFNPFRQSIFHFQPIQPHLLLGLLHILIKFIHQTLITSLSIRPLNFNQRNDKNKKGEQRGKQGYKNQLPGVIIFEVLQKNDVECLLEQLVISSPVSLVFDLKSMHHSMSVYFFHSQTPSDFLSASRATALFSAPTHRRSGFRFSGASHPTTLLASLRQE